MEDIDLESQKAANESHCILMMILIVGWFVSNILTAICQRSLVNSCEFYEPAFQAFDILFIFVSVTMLVVYRDE